jgi:hypothetical protein
MSSHKFDGFTKLDSGHMDGCKYSPSDRKLHVRFQNGYVYVVHGISADSYQQFLTAGSQGEHWHSQIKDHYHVERVR